MRLSLYALLMFSLLPFTVIAAPPHAHPATSKSSRASLDRRFTLAQRKKLFAEWMNISYRAIYDAKGNEILGDQLADKYRQQFARQHHMTLAEGHALELEGAAKQWPALGTSRP